jgi:iron complex outermembrane receptor protein
VDFIPHNQTYNIFSAFLQDEITLVRNRLSFTAGSKFEHNTFSGFEVQPSGRLLWTPSKQQTVWAAITRAVRTPSRIEDGFHFNALAVPSLPLYLRLVGDGGFFSEQLIGYEVGYRSLLRSGVYVDIATFYNQYDDLLSVEANTPFVETSPAPPHLVLPLFLRNGVRGFTRGIEVSPAWDVTRWWRLKGSYSFLHLNMRDKPTSVDASTVQQLQGDSPEHKAVIQSLLSLPKNFQLDLTYRYVSSLPDQNVDAYSTGDARLGWHLGEHSDFSVIGDNLFQPHHLEYAGDPGGPVGIKRGIHGQVTWRW